MGNSDEMTDTLKPQLIDYVALAAKGALGAIPYAGSLLAEIAGTIIPNQRIDRIVKFAEILAKKLSELEQSFVETQIKNEEFTDLVEEGIRQTARSLSDDRREYIASVLINSLSPDDIQYQESKHLLRILGEINDVEVIWLRNYAVATLGGDEEFRKKHGAILEPVRASLGSTQDVLDKYALQESYKKHLTQLGLLSEKLDVDSKTKQPIYDQHLNLFKTRGHGITPLGTLLLREIGFKRKSDAA